MIEYNFLHSNYSFVKENIMILTKLSINYNKKKTPIHQYAYMNNDTGEINKDKSPFSKHLEYLLENMNSVFINVECFRIDVNMLRSIRSINRILNDRISSLWNNRDFYRTKLILFLILYLDIHQTAFIYTDLYALISDKISKQCNTLQNQMISLLKFSNNNIIPSLYQRVYKYLESITSSIISEQLSSYFEQDYHIFSLMHYNRSVIHQIENLFNKLLCDKKIKSRKVQIEQYISDLLSKSSLIYLQEAFQIIEENNIVCPLIATTKKSDGYDKIYYENMKLAIYSININTALQSFLNTILNEKQIYFDESGVYRLFRILLLFQDCICVTKKKMNVATTYITPIERHNTNNDNHNNNHNSNTRIVKNIEEWEKAEKILQLLNQAIFHNHNNNTVSSSSNSYNTNICSNTNNNKRVLTEEEYNRWNQKVYDTNNGKYSLTTSITSTLYNIMSNSRSNNNNNNSDKNKMTKKKTTSQRKRHKGTVFVALELNFGNL